MIDIAIKDNTSPEILDIVKFYKTFDKYKNNTDKQLSAHIEPSIKLGQYKVNKKNNEIVSFTNWAFMNKKNEEHFEKTGQMLINFWNSGDKCWVIDSITKENSFKKVWAWGKEYFSEELDLKYVKWLRFNDNFKIKKSSVRYFKKEDALNE